MSTRPIRVLLGSDLVALRVSSRSTFRVHDARGRTVKLPATRWRLTGAMRLHGSHLHPPLRFVAGRTPLVLNGHGYRGQLVVYRNGSRLSVVDELPLERYLRGVVPWEMPWYWQPDALRAQAVAARSYALAVGHQGRIYDVVATTADQVYGGIRAEHAATNLAVGATAGLVVTWHGKPALTYYSSTSGGRTEAVADAFPQVEPRPYLVAVPDPYDGISPHHRWGPLRFAPRALARRLGVPSVRHLTLARNSSGRVATVTVAWTRGRRTFSGGDVERLLELPSTWFAFGPLRGAAAAPEPLHGYLAVLASLPAGSSTARSLARIKARVPDAQAVDSSAFPALRAGFIVICAGPYASAGDASAAAARVSGAYVRHV
jgi:stage II sporulation protein D